MGKPIHIIAEVPKNRMQRVRVALDQWEGHHLIDVRVIEAAADGNGWSMTHKGVSVNVSRIPELRLALEEAEAKARSLGWME